MKALVLKSFHELELVEVPEPEIVGADDVLIDVKAAGICGSDLHGYTGQSGRRTPPLIMGHEAAGVVLATGDAVTHIAPGTRVAINPIDQRESGRRLMGMDAPGAYAPRVVWPARNLHVLPDAVSFEAGSLAEPLGIAIHAVETAGVADRAEGTYALIVGAGTIGLLVASVLRHRGIGRIAISDLSDARLAAAKGLGVDVAINPRKEDATEAVLRMTHGRGVDLAFEAVGLGATVAQAHDALKYGGLVVWIGNNMKKIEVDMQQVVTREIEIRGTYGMSHENFAEAVELLAMGAIETDVLIHRRAGLDEGPTLFDELLTSPEVVKCIFTF